MRQPDTLGDDPAQGAGAAAAWERRGDESAPAYRAFRAYLELGPDRALRPVAEAAGCHLSLIKRWSARHEWRLRAAAWAESQRREAVAQETVQEAAYARRLHNAEQLERFAMAGLRSLVVRDGDVERRVSDEPWDVVEVTVFGRQSAHAALPCDGNCPRRAPARPDSTRRSTPPPPAPYGPGPGPNGRRPHSTYRAGLLANERVTRFLAGRHEELLEGLRQIVESTSPERWYRAGMMAGSPGEVKHLVVQRLDKRVNVELVLPVGMDSRQR